MKRFRWQILIVLLALAVIAALMLVQQPTTTLQPVASAQPASGGSYSEALVGTFGRLNPLLDYYNSVDRDVDRLIFSGLVRFDDLGIAQPDLAESWGISQDGLVYNFSIRPQATWHDGAPVTSEDVSFTAELLRDATIPVPEDIRTLWEQVEVNVLDDKTMQFRLPEPFAPFLDYLTFGVLPRHLLDSIPSADLLDAEFNLKPMGSGPFRFDTLLSENGQVNGVVLAAFDGYYGSRPFIDQVIFRYYPDSQAALSAYQQGEVLGISQVTADVLPQALKEQQFSLYTGRIPQLTLIYLNLDDPQLPFFQDASLRRALLMGLNRQWMADQVLGGQAILADGPIFPATWAYFDGIEHLSYDPEAALNAIKTAGYVLATEGSNVRSKDGVALSFELVYPGDATHTAMFEAIRRDWARLGVEVNPNPVSYEELIQDHLEPRAYQAALVELNLARSPDPDPYPFWDQAQVTGGQNYANWNDRQASEYLESARVSVDIGERTKAYRNFQVRFTQEMPALPLFYPVYSYAVNSQVQGVRMGPLLEPSDRFATLPTWYFLENVSPTLPVGETPTP